MIVNQKIPSLRFPEFDGEWETRNFGDIATNKSGKYNPLKETNSVKCIELEHLSSESSQLIDYIDGKNSGSIKNKFEKGDVLFGKLRPYLKKYLLAPFDGVCSSEIWVLKGINISNEFLFRIIQTDNFIDLANQSSGSKMPRADWNLVKNGVFSFPSLPEQTKIASFLTAVDDKLQALKHKLTLLEQYKKGVMQKIFAQELRFKPSPIEALEMGDEYPDWVEKKLGEVMSIRNEQATKSYDYPLMAFIQNIGVAPKGERYNREFLVNDGENKKYKKTEYGDFIYSSNNLETGSIGLNRYGPACISPVYSIFKVKKSFDFEFISTYLVRKNFTKKMIKFRQGVVYGQWKIHESEFLKIKEFIPSLNEQQKIASFLSAIDEKIEKTTQQLTQTETFKKGLLQQLFV
jgi:type I restriction enzyme S subunit